MKKTKVAVIGCGTIANTRHIPEYIANEKFEIKYFCDILPEKAEEAVRKYGCGTGAVTDYRAILDDSELDAVSVCTPNNMHAEISEAFLLAGKCVLCEKPAARTYEETERMLDAKRRSGKILNIGVVNRFNDSVNLIKNYIDSGKLGEVYGVYVSFRARRSIPGLGGAFTTKAVAGGGALIDWGVHFLDIVMYCCGDPAPVTVSGEIFCKLGRDMRGYVYEGMWAGPSDYNGTYDVEDSVTALIRTARTVITVNGAWAQNIGHDEMFIDFLGTEAGIRLKYGAEFEVFGTENGKLTQFVPEACKPENQTNMFANEIDAFLRCVETGEEIASGIETVDITARILHAIYSSAEKHAEIAFI